MGSRTRSTDGRSKKRRRYAFAGGGQITGDRHEADPERIEKRNASGQGQGNEAASAIAAGFGAIAILMDDTRRVRPGMPRILREDCNRIRLMTGRFVPVTGCVTVVSMVRDTRRHRAFLPRHCRAVEAERQDDQATQQ